MQDSGQPSISKMYFWNSNGHWQGFSVGRRAVTFKSAPQMEIERSSMSSSKMGRREYMKDKRNKTNHQSKCIDPLVCISFLSAEGQVNLVYLEENLKVNSHCAVKRLTFQNLTVC